MGKNLSDIFFNIYKLVTINQAPNPNCGGKKITQEVLEVVQSGGSGGSLDHMRRNKLWRHLLIATIADQVSTQASNVTRSLFHWTTSNRFTWYSHLRRKVSLSGAAIVHRRLYIK